ncbi:MAG: PEP-utilizing enzyme, mobile region, partial [Desulfobacca sp.]|nr:PEP-utilizing enzyme, mobile region [Desulfobacca sp.]
EEESLVLQRDLKGVAASPGVAEGICVVLSNIEELEKVGDGAILICETASPILTPVIPKVKALVTEQGGMLAMASRVAREYGIPAVVGIEGLMRKFHSGDRIRVDGSEGLVSVLS